MKIGFLGTGKMATAIARGLLQRKIVSATDIAGVDIAEEARAAFATATGVQAAATTEHLSQAADIIVIAVKPQVAKTAVKPLAGHCRDKLVISIAAGLHLRKLCDWLDSTRVIRVMPNTPAMVGRGASAFCCSNGVKPQDKEAVQCILDAVGTVIEVEEPLMDAVTAISGSGPAYVFEMISALADAGAACDLPREEALQLAIQTVAGAAEMLRCDMGSPEDLRDAVTSPGGTTEAGLGVLHKGQFRKLIADTVRAARDRSVELGQD